MNGSFPPAQHYDNVPANGIGDRKQEFSKIFPRPPQYGQGISVISQRQCQKTGQKRGISIGMPLVGTPSVRRMLRCIGKHIVINVGVSHAAEEKAVIQQDGQEEGEE